MLKGRKSCTKKFDIENYNGLGFNSVIVNSSKNPITQNIKFVEVIPFVIKLSTHQPRLTSVTELAKSVSILDWWSSGSWQKADQLRVL
jgi:hypothetical protein